MLPGCCKFSNVFSDSTWDPALSYPGFHLAFCSILPGIPPGVPLCPTWDPVLSYPGFHLGSCSILPGILLYPTRDSTWDPALPYTGSHLGSCSILPGIPPGILLYPTRVPTWDPALCYPCGASSNVIAYTVTSLLHFNKHDLLSILTKPPSFTCDPRHTSVNTTESRDNSLNTPGK